MLMFGRKKDEVGLYTGDAPVSAPGFDGAEPSAYRGAPAGAPSTAPVSDGAAPVMPPAPGFNPAGISVTGGIPSDADLVRLEQLVAQKVPPEFAGRAMEQIERLRAQSGTPMMQPGGPTSVGGPYGGGPGYPGGPMLIPGRRRTPGRGAMVGCLVAVVILAAVIGGAAFFIVHAVRDGAAAVFGPGNPAAGSIGVPVSVGYDDATLSLTVGKAVLQPSDPWGLASADDHPVLLVEVDMARTDAGTDPVTVLGWDWSFTPTAGKTVTGDIIGEYEPDLAGPELSAGQSARGWVSFDTAAISGTLGFSDSAAIRPMATWSVTASKPSTVSGTLGKPARGEISDPPFTVTITNPHQVAGTSTAVQTAPKSGHYLALTAVFVVDSSTGPFAGEISDGTFVFVPTGGKPVPTAGYAMTDSIGYTALDPGKRSSGVLAFDTTATTGTLTMRDGAGHAVITWPISAPAATSKPPAHPSSSTAPPTRKTG